MFAKNSILIDLWKSIGKDDGKVVYGKKEVQDALRFGKIDTLLLSDDIGK